MIRRSSWLALAMLLAGTPVAHAVTADLRDFLIEDVCVSANGVPIAGDPYSCPLHRDARAGEQLRYLHVDRGLEIGLGLFYHFQSFFSFPVASPNPADANPRVAVIKDFGRDDIGTSFGDLDRCSGGTCDVGYRDGYDVIEMNGNWVSFVGTSDPVINDQSFWREGCAPDSHDPADNEDSWILFPSDLPSGAQGSTVARLAISTDDACPGSGFASAYTTWQRLAAPVLYTSGKSLETIVSTHFSGASAAEARAFERFFFTRPYGFTRWEAWQRSDACGLLGCVPKLVGCNGGSVEVVDGASFVRTDCRDATDVIDLPYPLEPTLFTPPPQLSATQDLIEDGTFANQVALPWSIVAQVQSFVLDARTLISLAKNVALQVACTSACNPAVYQDVDVRPWANAGRQTIRFGSALKADAAAAIDVIARLYDANGVEVDAKRLHAELGPAFQTYGTTFDWDFSAAPLSRIRLEYALSTTGLDYAIDEAYLTLDLPRTPEKGPVTGPASPSAVGGGGAMPNLAVLLALLACRLARRRRP